MNLQEANAKALWLAAKYNVQLVRMLCRKCLMQFNTYTKAKTKEETAQIGEALLQKKQHFKFCPICQKKIDRICEDESNE